MQPADAIHRATSLGGEVGHVERLASVSGIAPPQRHELIEGETQPLGAIAFEMSWHEIHWESVEACLNGRVRCKSVSGARDGQRQRKSFAWIIHIACGTLQDGKRRVAFVEMAHLRVNRKRAQQAPATDSAHLLLL
jgi:hypothetical protein